MKIKSASDYVAALESFAAELPESVRRSVGAVLEVAVDNKAAHGMFLAAGVWAMGDQLKAGENMHVPLAHGGFLHIFSFVKTRKGTERIVLRVPASAKHGADFLREFVAYVGRGRHVTLAMTQVGGDNN